MTLQGDGRGGRDQEFVLAGAIALDGTDHVVLLAGGTNGADGRPDAAGTIADRFTVARPRS